MIEYTVVLGWHKSNKLCDKIKELKLIVQAKEDISKEKLKRIVAENLGRKYPKTIEFSWFDISYDSKVQL